MTHTLKIRFLLGILLFLGANIFEIKAIEVGWHPEMVIDIGDGVKLNNQKVAAFPAFVQLSNTPTNLNNGWQNEVVTFAQNTYDIVKTLNINSAVSVNALFTSANIDVSFFSRQTFDANALTFVFTKTRDFGTTLYSPVGFSSVFAAELPIFQRTLQGEALHSKITSTFGSHYVRGYESAAVVSVIYTFHYTSATVKQTLNFSASGDAFDGGSFSAFVNAFFGSTNTAVNMTYQFYSSEANAPFQSTGVITNYMDFTSFVNRLEAYGNSMSPNNAKRVGYVLDPIESIPGYLSVLGGYIPPPVNSDGSSDFVRLYTALQIWNQRLGLAASAMSWLNPQGQQVLTSKAADIANYLGALDLIVSNHYTTGAPLSLPDDAVTYLANLSDIKLPQIYVLDAFTDQNGTGTVYRYVVGSIDCGDRTLVKASPFNRCTELNNGVDNGTSAQIFYDPVQFQTTATNNYSDSTGTYNDSSTKTKIAATFASEQWACLTNPATNPDLIGYFLARQAYANTPAWSLAIRDERGTNVDVMPFLQTRSAGCGSPGLFSSTPAVAVSILPSDTGVIGTAQPVAVQVTNASSAQSYGTSVSFTLGAGFEFNGANGSQGYASYDPTGRTVSCRFGPLMAGSSASLYLQLIPLQTNAVPGSSPVLLLGGGLTNSAPSNPVNFSQINSVLPILNPARSSSGLLLDWWSDTDHLVVEGSLGIGPSASWSPITNGMLLSANHRFLPTDTQSSQTFYRLHVR